jgi:hypothetical protein
VSGIFLSRSFATWQSLNPHSGETVPRNPLLAHAEDLLCPHSDLANVCFHRAVGGDGLPYVSSYAHVTPKNKIRCKIMVPVDI